MPDSGTKLEIGGSMTDEPQMCAICHQLLSDRLSEFEQQNIREAAELVDLRAELERLRAEVKGYRRIEGLARHVVNLRRAGATSTLDTALFDLKAALDAAITGE